MKEILEKLNLSAVNPGSWSGTQSMQTDKEKLIESINPSSKEVIASVINTNNDEYQQIIKNAQEAAKNGKRYQLLSVGMLSEELVNHSESIRMHSEALLALKWEKLKLKVTVKFRR